MELLLPLGWGQDGVSKASKGFGQRYWLGVMTGREHRKWRVTSARRAACNRHAVRDCGRAACGCHGVRGFCFGRPRRCVPSIRIGSISIWSRPANPTAAMPGLLLDKAKSQPHLKQVGHKVGHKVNPTSGKRAFGMYFKCIMHE